MTLPNRLTLARIVLSFGVIALIMLDGWWARLSALLLFWVAGATDWIDGYIARRTKTVSDFGKMADPLADKILVAGALIAFVKIKGLGIPPWVPFLVVAREFIVMGLRSLAALKGKVLAADNWGKTKTVVQIAGISLILIYRVVEDRLDPGLLRGLEDWPLWLCLVMVAATWISGGVYLFKNRSLLMRSW